MPSAATLASKRSGAFILPSSHCVLWRHYGRRSDFAGRRLPLRTIRLLLEERIGDERFSEVLGILDDRHDVKPLSSVRARRVALEIFGDDRVFAVGYAVLPDVTGAHVGGRDLERAAGAWRRWAADQCSKIPLGGRSSLPRPFGVAEVTGQPLRIAEAQQPRLRTSVCLDFQSVRVLPGDVQATGHTHDAADAERLAPIAFGDVFGQVPG